MPPPAFTYLPGRHHSGRLIAALEELHQALTRRWREAACDTMMRNRPDLLTAIAADGPHHHLWDYLSLPARHHLGGSELPGTAHAGYCAYIQWVRAGQPGSLSGVACEGFTGPHSQLSNVPRYIRCGVGSILRSVEEWAWAERQHLFGRLPLFDSQDLDALREAHDALADLAMRLGLQLATSSAPDRELADVELQSRPLPLAVDAVTNPGDKDWLVNWTGLAADWARGGFFESPLPTMFNQAGIAAFLANLYSLRATIIEKGRNDALYWIQWATRSLDATQPITTDHTEGWKVVQVAGLGVSTAFGWTGSGAVAGAAISLVGFLGEEFLPETRQEAYEHGLTEVVAALHEKLTGLNLQLHGLELDYYDYAARLETAIQNTHSYHLELYDLTRNNPGGVPGRAAGFEVDLDDLLTLGRRCHHAGRRYEELLPIISATAVGDSHLADQDGVPTRADRRVLQLRDLLASFLRTTWARYAVASDQLREGVISYAEQESAGSASLDRLLESWDSAHTGAYNVGLDRHDEAVATDRPSWAGDRDTYAADVDYATEEDS